jgi:phage terminase small subunit
MPFQKYGEIKTKGKGSRLGAKQLLFVEAYCLPDSETFQNPHKSVLKAGYVTKNATQIGRDLMQHPLIMKEVKERMEARRERLELTADYVIHKLMNMIENDEEKMKHSDTIRALELLGKSLALWKERQEISGPDGKAIEMEQKVKQDVNEFTSRIASLTARTGTSDISVFPKPSGDGGS